MTRRAWITVSAACALLALAQFFACLCPLWAALGVAALLPPAGLALMRYFEAGPVTSTVRIAAPAVAAAAGCLLGSLAGARGLPLSLAPPIAGLIAAAIEWWRRRASRRCVLCSNRLTGLLSFVCPRCGLEVCEARCWEFSKLRCRLCVQNRVPAFDFDARWWDRNFGAPARHGRCELCQASAAEAELRCCPNCGRPHCRECWDDLNGACSRCHWVAPGLPDALKQYVS